MILEGTDKHMDMDRQLRDIWKTKEEVKKMTEEVCKEKNLE